MMKSESLAGVFAQRPDIVSLQFDLPRDEKVELDCLRLDQMHPFVSGNKWFKLKHHLEAALSHGKHELLSFGGAYSNHLHALAYAGQQCGLKTRALVRGEAPKELSPTLQDCKKWGMQIEWVSREDYSALAGLQARDSLVETYPDAWVIPEGGEGEEGVAGVRDLFTELSDSGDFKYDYICCPVGSGTTLAGIVAADIPEVRCIGFSALKGAHDLESRVENLLAGSPSRTSWQICHEYHFGGFAKMNPRLRDFISSIHTQTELMLDPVYTGKTLFGLMEWLHQGRLPAQSKVLFVHTGGLQGWRGFGESGPGVWDHE